MGIISFLKGKLGGQTTLFAGGMHSGGFSYANGTLASNETIFSAVTMLSGAIASLPVTLRLGHEKVAAERHAVARMFGYAPNPSMTPFQFIRCMETLRDTTGAGYAVKELDSAGQVVALWLMKTELVQPMVERESREVYYRVRDDLSGEAVYLHSSCVIAVTHISTDGISPISPIAVLRSSLDYDREVKEFSVDQMQNGLRANLAISIRGNLSKAQLDEYNDTVRAFKRSGVLYLDDGKSITELKGASIIDPKVFEVENITVARVARVYTIPLEKFLPDRTSYSSAEQSDLNYLRDTILPIARMYEQEFSRKLLSELELAEGMQIKFSLNGFARADMATRGNFYMKGIRTGWFCLDDVRALEDLPPLPDGQGKEYYISRDLVPVRTLAEQNGKDEANGRTI